MVAAGMAGVRAAGAAMVGRWWHRGLQWYAGMAVASLSACWLWSGAMPDDIRPQDMLVGFYRQVVGHLDGRSCPSYPVCSQYAEEAIGRYGIWLGSWLVLDRLIHEADDLHRGAWIVYGGEKRLFDPLSRNDFLLRGREQ